ncbi:MAG: hypothetical protein JWO44_1609 [Bacteroidetes bacterium]|nr:hypothetical protein [Bacteroidota bacterium]
MHPFSFKEYLLSTLLDTLPSVDPDNYRGEMTLASVRVARYERIENKLLSASAIKEKTTLFSRTNQR